MLDDVLGILETGIGTGRDVGLAEALCMGTEEGGVCITCLTVLRGVTLNYEKQVSWEFKDEDVCAPFILRFGVCGEISERLIGFQEAYVFLGLGVFFHADPVAHIADVFCSGHLLNLLLFDLLLLGSRNGKGRRGRRGGSLGRSGGVGFFLVPEAFGLGRVPRRRPS